LITGCGSGYEISTQADMSTITVIRGIIHFSFECPTDYKVDKTYFNNNSTSLSIKAPLQKEEKTSLFIKVFVQKAIDNKSVAQRLEADISRVSHFPDFVFLDRSTITVAGQPGEQYTFSQTMPIPDFQLRRGLSPFPGMEREVFFDTDGKTWQLSLYFNKTTAELGTKYEEDFEHLLANFKVVN
jgi:hypothetical protein